MPRRSGADARLRIEARFLTSAPDLARCPSDDLPEVAIAGRSNAGKSSVLNQITGNRQLARTSKTPGRTQLLNLFTTSLGGRLVDLPGYGYARASKAQQRAWREHVEHYLSARSNLVALLLVMDIRHSFQPFDEQLLDWARASGLPTHVLLNKADKLGHGARTAALREAEQTLAKRALTDAAAARVSVQVFSATTGLGRETLIERLTAWLTPAGG